MAGGVRAGLRKNRFPSRVMAASHCGTSSPTMRSTTRLRYRGTVEDETRLLYVAVTRSAEVPVRDVRAGRRQPAAADPLGLLRPHRRAAMGVDDFGADQGGALTPQPVHETPQVTLSFSELKHLFQCLYEFKLRFLRLQRPDP